MTARRLIISTSTSCLDNFKKPDNIRMLRMHIQIYGQDYRDGESITTNTLAQMMRNDPNLLPLSSAPSENEIAEFLQKLVDEGVEEVLIVCISTFLSETLKNINAVKGLFADSLKIHIFDTRNIAYTEGILALEAAKLLAQGIEIPHIIEHLTLMRTHYWDMFAIADVRNMVKTERISAPAGFIASLFNIKPILQFTPDGRIVPVERVRHMSNTLRYMCDALLARLQGKNAFVYIMTCADNKYTPRLLQMLQEAGFDNVPVVPVAATSVANLGITGIGIGAFIL